MMSNGRRGAAFGVGVLVVALAAAGIAGASSTPFVSGFQSQEFDTANHSLKCPAGKVPASGGVSLEQTPSSQDLQASHPSGRKWIVDVRNHEASKRSGNVIALCAKDKGIIVKSKEGTAGALTTDFQLDAHCPKGSKAVGGGGQLTAPGTATQIGSFPTNGGKAWGTRWKLPADGYAVDLKAYAVCDKRIRGYNVVETATPFGKRGSFGELTAVANCESGDKLAGGGYFRLDSSWIINMGPAQTTGWLVDANAGEGSGSPLLSFAVCGS